MYQVSKSITSLSRLSKPHGGNIMVLIAEAKIVKNPKAHTQYITVPAVLTQDSAYPFKEDDEVQVEIVTECRKVENGILLVKPRPSSAKSK